KLRKYLSDLSFRDQHQLVQDLKTGAIVTVHPKKNPIRIRWLPPSIAAETPFLDFDPNTGFPREILRTPLPTLSEESDHFSTPTSTPQAARTSLTTPAAVSTTATTSATAPTRTAAPSTDKTRLTVTVRGTAAVRSGSSSGIGPPAPPAPTPVPPGPPGGDGVGENCENKRNQRPLPPQGQGGSGSGGVPPPPPPPPPPPLPDGGDGDKNSDDADDDNLTDHERLLRRLRKGKARANDETDLLSIMQHQTEQQNVFLDRLSTAMQQLSSSISPLHPSPARSTGSTAQSVNNARLHHLAKTFDAAVSEPLTSYENFLLWKAELQQVCDNARTPGLIESYADIIPLLGKKQFGGPFVDWIIENRRRYLHL
ncbi:hypothetical protein HK102_012285, partial [Quaeritorhiza haematococci]